MKRKTTKHTRSVATLGDRQLDAVTGGADRSDDHDIIVDADSDLLPPPKSAN